MPDLTAPFVNFTVHSIGSYGLWAIFFLMLLESACIPIPSEAIMLYGGFLVSAGQQSFWAVVIVGVLGNLAGSLIAYWVGATKGREWVLEIKWLHVTPKRLEQAERYFARRGDITVLVCRCLPLLRTFISLPAGIARMPIWRFITFTVIGCVPWVIGLTLLGEAVGANWKSLERHLHVVDYVIVAAVIVGIVWLIMRSARSRRDSAGGPATP
jgi:membrane protein DedA with SNARE-associated domain